MLKVVHADSVLRLKMLKVVRFNLRSSLEYTQCGRRFYGEEVPGIDPQQALLQIVL